MGIGMPAYPTLMELRTAGWTLQQIAKAYEVAEPEIQRALALHFINGQRAGWRPPRGAASKQRQI
jgi:ribosomal protein L32E